jgi:beta-lactamase class A
MSHLALSRRGFLQLAGGIAPLALFPTAMWPSNVFADEPGNVCRINALSVALQGVAARASGGLGVAVVDMTGGGSCAVRGDEPFLLHSSVKLMVAASVADRISRGTVTLQTPVTLRRAMRPGGVGPVDVALRDAGDQTVSVQRLLEAIMLYSDNAACDGLMTLAGGPAAIQEDLHRWSVAGIRVDRTMRELYAPFNTATSDAESQRHYDALLADPRDRATPDGYANFARRLVAGVILDATGTAIVMQAWQRSALTPNRITAGLGAGWTVASRSGTGPTVNGRTTATNHAVLATSPAGRPVIVAAFLRDAPGNDAERAAVLAEVGKAVAAACGAA